MEGKSSLDWLTTKTRTLQGDLNPLLRDQDEEEEEE